MAQLVGALSCKPRRLQVLFLIRAHAQVVSSIPGRGAYRRQPVDVSLSLSLSLSVSLSLSLSVSLSLSLPQSNKIKSLGEGKIYIRGRGGWREGERTTAD